MMMMMMMMMIFIMLKISDEKQVASCRIQRSTNKYNSDNNSWEVNMNVHIGLSFTVYCNGYLHRQSEVLYIDLSNY